MSDKLFDTTVLIDLLRGNPTAADYLDAERATDTVLFVSAVSAMELFVGCRNKSEVTRVQQFITEFRLLHLTPDTSAKAVEFIMLFNKSYGLDIPDAFIAATAVTHHLTLVSDNVRHFFIIPDLVVNRPY